MDQRCTESPIGKLNLNGVAPVKLNIKLVLPVFVCSPNDSKLLKAPILPFVRFYYVLFIALGNAVLLISEDVICFNAAISACAKGAEWIQESWLLTMSASYNNTIDETVPPTCQNITSMEPSCSFACFASILIRDF